MAHSLTNASRKVLASATEAARSFNHAYVGTEHLLLALIEEGSAGVKEILETFKIDAAMIRAEIAKLVTRGQDAVTLLSLPLTPRAKQAIEHAGDETRLMNEKCIAPEHLFLGLAKEASGVACQVLLNLGIQPIGLRREVFKVRIAQMKIVERAIRPLRASTTRKRKVREELLAHLSAIYDQERARLHDSAAALAAAAIRFGDPLRLAEELQVALPIHERISFFVEQWFTWKAPESVRQYSLRQATVAFCILAAVLPIVFVGVILRFGWFDDVWTFIRVLSCILFITSPAQFIFTLAWIKMRDAMWGVFGSRKSSALVLLYATAIGGVVTVSLLGLAWATRWNLDIAIDSLKLASIAGVVSAITSLAIVRAVGPVTIRDTAWAMLDLDVESA